MKKLFMMLLFLFIIYFGIQIGFRFVGTGHDSEYKIVDGNNIFYIYEKYNRETKIDPANYLLQIKINDNTFSYTILDNFYAKEAIVDSIKYYKDDIDECIYVRYSGSKIITDVMCKKDSVITYYHNMNNPSEKLSTFVSSLANYDKSNWENNQDDLIVEYPLTIYTHNIIKNNYVGLENYKGLYTISDRNLKKVFDVSLFEKDSYSREINGIVNETYTIANYSETDGFTEFKTVDLIDNTVNKISYHSKISFNSYVQGTIDNSIYLFDRDSRKQYEINLKSKTVVEVGNSSDGIKFYNLGTWETKEANEAYQNNLYFINSNNDYKNNDFYNIDKIGNTSGYYYLYKKVSDGIEVYRANIDDKETITYLFKTNSIRNINYIDSFIYFIDGDTLKYYSDATGVRTLVVNEELNFNNKLSYFVYIKK